MQKRIAYITGSRADYGLMRPVLRAIQACPSLELGLIVTGMHLGERYGQTVSEVEADGYRIVARVPTLLDNDSGVGAVKAMALSLLGFAQALAEFRPTMLLLQGDRIETLAGAITGAHLNIILVHLSGGDASGTVDEPTRHAISKFAHLHLVNCARSALRLRSLGEPAQRILEVGEPSLDAIRTLHPVPPAQLAQMFGLDLTRPVIVAIQHPVTTEKDKAGAQMRETMEALRILRQQTILIYPNSDPGSRAMIEVTEAYRTESWLRVSQSLPSELFLSLLKIAGVLVGNSSSGIVEAPSFHLPAVNIGTRQSGRTRTCNVIDANYDRHEIAAAVERCLHDRQFLAPVQMCQSPYGDGRTAERIVGVLENLSPTSDFLQKSLAG